MSPGASTFFLGIFGEHVCDDLLKAFLMVPAISQVLNLAGSIQFLNLW